MSAAVNGGPDLVTQELMLCRVCGYEDDAPPWGHDSKSPEFFICPCCGVEHGYEDCTRDAAVRYRELWLANGAKWSNPKLKPEGWNVTSQLKVISEKWI